MRKIILMVIIVLAAQGLLSAQGKSLSLDDIRDLALINSRSLAKYNLAIQSSLLTERLQTYSNFPSLSLGVSASASLWTSDGIPQNLFKDSFSAGASFGVSQRLWNGGKNSIQKAINSLGTEMSRQDALAEYYSVLKAADSAYYGVLEAAASLEVAESSLETAALSLSMAEIRRQSGMISESAYLQTLAEKAGRETSRNQSRRDLAIAKLKLKDLTGLDEAPNLLPVDFDSRESIITLLSNSSDEGIEKFFTVLWKQMQTRNPSMIKAALSFERTEKNVGLSKRDYSPTLSASVSTGLNYTINNGLEPSGGRLSMSASFPIDVWVTAANVEKQKIARDQAALDYRSSVSSMDMELRTLLYDLISQAGQILSSRRALDYAQKHFDYVLELYRLSRNSPSELSDAETLVRNNRNQLSRSQYSFLTGLSRIRSMGSFDSEEEIISLVHAVFNEAPVQP